MRLTLILAHPDPESLNHAAARAAHEALKEAAGHEVTVHDLYAERFDPRLTTEEIRNRRSDDALVERHARELVSAHGLVIVHPVWFDHVPAILKGWVDRVVREGSAYERAEGGEFRGLTMLEAALLVTTANITYRSNRGDGPDRFWRDWVLPTCGVTRIERVHLSPVVGSTLATRRAWLEEIAECAEATFPGD